ncbi:MAG: class I SAM-dependent methyltransferase, partial [Bradyrhizobium sp.]
GAHIPVLPSSALLTEKPDVTVILAWIYAEPILKRNEAYLAGGGRFLVPLAEPRIVDKRGTLAL